MRDTRRARATIVDIAARAGVSKSTVSLVLRNSPLARQQTAERVRDAMRELGYVYNRGAANLRRARSNVVGVVVSDIVNPFFAELAVGLENAFLAAGYLPILVNTGEDRERQARVIQALREQAVAGLVVSAADRTEAAAIKSLAASGLPVTLAMRDLPGSGLPYVGQDNLEGARVATRHLLSLGHARIAFLAGSSSIATHRERVDGYRRALAEVGVAFDPSLVIEAPPMRESGEQVVARALALPAPPRAALCFNDLTAIAAMSALQRRGLRPGADFAIVGFDDIEEGAHVDPPLTTVSMQTDDLARTAARVLVELIEGGAPPAAPIYGVARLVVRGSCGAAAARR
ncbi:MAG: LacI family DNA-binding transcriptional regulator [Hyphomicrobiales bacterium]|nr:LacI family DNA-binding transcriptional regulator [Hyphomicrobiales bacterium]